MTDQNKTSISVFLVIGPECMLPRCMLPLACHGEYMMGQTDRHMDGRQTITLCFSLDAASVIIKKLSN